MPTLDPLFVFSAIRADPSIHFVQALVNAHNNPDYTSIRSSTVSLVFFGTPHGGGNTTLVGLGSAAAKVATALHLQSQNHIVETLKSGSLFSDLLKEHWRQQLESYQIVSFWEGIGNVVPKSSAIFGLPGTRERILELNADHSDLCRFDGTRRDQDNFKKVSNNIQEMYEAALERSESVNILYAAKGGAEATNEDQEIDQDLEARFASLA